MFLLEILKLYSMLRDSDMLSHKISAGSIVIKMWIEIYNGSMMMYPGCIPGSLVCVCIGQKCIGGVERGFPMIDFSIWLHIPLLGISPTPQKPRGLRSTTSWTPTHFL